MKKTIHNTPLPDAVSVVVRSKDEGHYLEDTLKALFSQDYDGRIDLIVIDSGSIDESLDIIRSYKPKEFVEIRAEEYMPGKILNRAMEMANTEWVVFLNADATPANDQWLKNLLLTVVRIPKVGAAYGAQQPREDCKGIFAHDYQRCYGENREAEDWEHFFSMVSSIVHRPTWETIRFREDIRYSEDYEWTLRIRAAGYSIRFSRDSLVTHSHNYTAGEVYRRHYGDAVTNAAVAQGSPVRWSFFFQVVIGTFRVWLSDLKFLAKHGKLSECFHALVIRIAQRLGNWKGFHSGWKIQMGARDDQ